MTIQEEILSYIKKNKIQKAFELIQKDCKAYPKKSEFYTTFQKRYEIALAEEKAWKIEVEKIKHDLANTINRLGTRQKTVKPLKNKTINIFIDYHKSDEKTSIEFIKIIDTLKSLFDLNIWHHGMVRAGQAKYTLMEKSIKQSDVIILFINASYILSESYRYFEKEVAKRYNDNKIKLFPIITKNCMWEYGTIGKLDVVKYPKNENSLLDIRNTNKVFMEIGLDLRKKLETI